jgi:hypothetical protein
MSAGGNRRLARQGKRDARLSLAFDDQFKPRFNTGGGRTAADVNEVPVFVSHSSGKMSDRQRLAVNVGFYCMTQRRCYCAGNCGCGSTMLFDGCAPRLLCLSPLAC